MSLHIKNKKILDKIIKKVNTKQLNEKYPDIAVEFLKMQKDIIRLKKLVANAQATADKAYAKIFLAEMKL